MNKKILNIVLLIVSLISLGFLIGHLLKQPIFMGITTYLIIKILSIILISCSLIGLILKLIFKKQNFYTIFFSLLIICSVLGISYLLKPAYEIIVPENYVGEVNLILSNVKENRLTLDENGIGYINKKTFNKTFNPIILQKDTIIGERIEGFNTPTFWSKLITTTSDGKIFAALNFVIPPENKNGEYQYNDTMDLSKLVDYKLVLAE